MQQDDNQKNLLIAVMLSVMVLLGWQLFFVNPKIEQEKRARQQQTQTVPSQPAPGAPAATGVPVQAPGGVAQPVTPVAPAGIVLPREQVLAQTPRANIRTPSVVGSINLRGGRIDDLALVKYRQTPDQRSPPVVLLSPLQTAEPYYADAGWFAPPGVSAKVPDAHTEWRVEKGGTLTPDAPVTLRWDNDAGLIFRRTISVDNQYMFNIDDTVENTSTSALVLNHYASIGRQGTPKLEGFLILHEGPIGVANDKLQEISFSKALEVKAGQTVATNAFEKQKGSWFGITDKYWATALIPDKGLTTELYLHGFPKPQGSPVKESYNVSYQVGGVTVAPQATQTIGTRLFAGAKEVKTIEAYEKALSINKFELLVDWGWFYFITKPMYHVIDWLAGFFGRLGFSANFGLAILATTVLVKAAFFWLANKSYESMAKMKKLQPEMEKIRDRYKDDRMKQQQEMMELYKKEKINPMAGCLPIVVQIPVFFALYKVLFIALDMRHAPFYGWVKDLAAADPTNLFNLFGLLPFDPTTLPLLGPLLHVGLWPIIMGITMYIQMQLNPQQPDPVQQMIFNWMPVMFTFMLAAFPVGLVIYWAWNNILSLIQQYAINKKHGAEIHLWRNLGFEKVQGWIKGRKDGVKEKG